MFNFTKFRLKLIKKQIRWLADLDKDGPSGNLFLRRKIDQRISSLKKLNVEECKKFLDNENLRREHDDPYLKSLGHFDPDEVKIGKLS